MNQLNTDSISSKYTPDFSSLGTKVAAIVTASALLVTACGSGGDDVAISRSTTTEAESSTTTIDRDGFSTTDPGSPVTIDLDQEVTADDSTTTTTSSNAPGSTGTTGSTSATTGRVTTTTRYTPPPTAPPTTPPVTAAPTTTRPPSPTTTEKPQNNEAKKAEFRAEFLRLLKDERAKNGLAAPSVDSRVEIVADKLCNKLMNESWGHYTAQQRKDLLAQQGYNTDLTTGEALRADGSNQNVGNTDMKAYAKFLLNDWMGSPSHKAVLMSAQNTNFGFCVIWGVPTNGDPGMEGGHWIMGGLINARPPA